MNGIYIKKFDELCLRKQYKKSLFPVDLCYTFNWGFLEKMKLLVLKPYKNILGGYL